MADDDDYMSDKFIVNTEMHMPPSLIKKYSDKRMIALTKRKAAADISNGEKKKLQCIMMEREKRDEGLSSAISADNKGFKMIMKMGYKPGQGIGKNESGRSEPIPMNIKINRLGLGRINENSFASKVATQSTNTHKLHDAQTDQFRDRFSSKKLEQLMEVDLIKSQIVCEELDIKCKVNEPVESWYWPHDLTVKKICGEYPGNSEENNHNGACRKEKDKEEQVFGKVDEVTNHCEDNEVLIEISTINKLENITQYLREHYAYCIWCGIPYDDQNDLNENCPGNTRSHH